MKKILTAAVVLLITATSLLAQNPRNLYKKYSDEKGVSAVYISPAMFRLIGHLPEFEVNDGDVDISPIIRNISGMYILDCEDYDVARRLKNDVERYIDSGEYEMLMEAKEDGETVRIYTVGDKKIVRSFVLLSCEGDETTFISFEGEIPREKLEQAIANAAD